MPSGRGLARVVAPIRSNIKLAVVVLRRSSSQSVCSHMLYATLLSQMLLAAALNKPVIKQGLVWAPAMCTLQHSLNPSSSLRRKQG